MTTIFRYRDVKMLKIMQLACIHNTNFLTLAKRDMRFTI